MKRISNLWLFVSLIVVRTCVSTIELLFHETQCENTQPQPLGSRRTPSPPPTTPPPPPPHLNPGNTIGDRQALEKRLPRLRKTAPPAPVLARDTLPILPFGVLPQGQMPPEALQGRVASKTSIEYDGAVEFKSRNENCTTSLRLDCGKPHLPFPCWLGTPCPIRSLASGANAARSTPRTGRIENIDRIRRSG